jgi:hypothetical protein
MEPNIFAVSKVSTPTKTKWAESSVAVLEYCSPEITARPTNLLSLCQKIEDTWATLHGCHGSQV